MISNEEGCVAQTQKIRLPEPPPNYGGTVCGGVDYIPSCCRAEGIERLVNNDSSYSERVEMCKKRGDDCTSGERVLPVSEKDPFPQGDNESVGGIKRIVESLGKGSFDPEDVLLCAMIMLMLNSRSEDDIIMIIVLMMLL